MRFLGTVTIFVALALAWMMVSAHAKDLVPRQFRGHWCGAVDSDDGYKRTTKPCAPAEDVSPLTVRANETYFHADDGTTYGRCRVEAVSPYKPRGYRGVYLASMNCGDPTVDGLYWFYLENGRLIHLKSSRG